MVPEAVPKRIRVKSHSIGKLSFEDLIKKSKAIEEMLDSTVQMVDDLQVNYLLDSSDVASKKFADVLLNHWQPIFDSVSNFQVNWNKTINEVLTDQQGRENKRKDKMDNLLNEKDVDLYSQHDNMSYSSNRTDEFNTESLPPPTFDSDVEPPQFDSDNMSCNESLNAEEVLDILDNIGQEMDDNLVENYNNIPIPVKDSIESLNINKSLFDAFLKSEKLYQSVLYSLNMLFNAFYNYATNEKNTALVVETQKIFGKIPELTKFHSSWLETLEDKQGSGEEVTKMCEFILSLRQQFTTYKAHSDNHIAALESLHRVWGLKGVVSEIVPKFIVALQIKYGTEDALYRPVSRLIDYFTLITELHKNLSYNSEYYETLCDIREELNLFSELIRFNAKDKKGSQRVLVKWTPIVEDSGGEHRKHRILVMLTDFIICAGENSKGAVVLKWHCALKKLKMIDEVDDAKRIGCEFVPVDKNTVDLIRGEINRLKIEINSSDQRKNKKFEKLKRTLEDKMSELVLKFSSCPLFLFLADGKKVLLLFMTEDNRKSWERLLKVRKNSPFIDQKQIFLSEVNEALESISHNLGNSLNSLLSYCLINKDNVQSTQIKQLQTSTLKGKLFIKCKALRNSDIKSDPTFNVEIDKHKENAKNSKLTKTNILSNEIVTIDLEAFHGLVCISTGRISKNDPTGLFSVNLISEGITKCLIIRKKKVFKWGEALMFFEFSSTSSTSQHINNFNPFNPSIDKIVEYEGGSMPFVVQWSCKYIQDNGLDEVGIYRVSGASTKTEMARQLWLDGFMLSYDDMEKINDVNVIAGLFKRFLRELTIPLIPVGVLYKILKFDYENGTISDFNTILDELPDLSRTVFASIMNHLLVVQRYEDDNKMSFQNISTVFGVNMLKVADSGTNTMGLPGMDMSILITTFSYILEFWKSNNPVNGG